MTNTPPGLSTVPNAMTSANLAKWTDALNEAVNWCKSNQAGTQFFLIGFSLGGYMQLAAPLRQAPKVLLTSSAR